jgi:hypothetical protein
MRREMALFMTEYLIDSWDIDILTYMGRQFVVLLLLKRMEVEGGGR